MSYLIILPIVAAFLLGAGVSYQKFENIEKDYEAKVKGITGVIESGLFIGYPVEIIVPSR